MKGVVILAMLVVVAVVATKKGEAAVSCGQVDSTMAPCVGYLTQGGGAPPATCCNAVKTVRDMTQTQPDRQAVCECLKAAATRFSIKPDLAAGLPTACNVPISVPISPTVNCRTIA